MVPYHAEIRFCYVTMLLSNTLPTPTTTVFWRTMGWFQGLTFHYSPQKKKHFLIKILFVCVLCVYVCGTRHPEGQRAILGVHPCLPPCLKTALFSGVCHCVYTPHELAHSTALALPPVWPQKHWSYRCGLLTLAFMVPGFKLWYSCLYSKCFDPVNPFPSPKL